MFKCTLDLTEKRNVTLCFFVLAYKIAAQPVTFNYNLKMSISESSHNAKLFCTWYLLRFLFSCKIIVLDVYLKTILMQHATPAEAFRSVVKHLFKKEPLLIKYMPV